MVVANPESDLLRVIGRCRLRSALNADGLFDVTGFELV